MHYSRDVAEWRSERIHSYGRIPHQSDSPRRMQLNRVAAQKMRISIPQREGGTPTRTTPREHFGIRGREATPPRPHTATERDSPFARGAMTYREQPSFARSVLRDSSPLRRNNSPLRSPSTGRFGAPLTARARVAAESPPRRPLPDSPSRGSPRKVSSAGQTWAARLPTSLDSPIAQVSRDAPQFLPSGLPISDFHPPEPDPRTFTPLLPPKDRLMSARHTLILDLDETLVHSSFKPMAADHVVSIELDGAQHQVYVRKRPFVNQFLARMSEIFEVAILTASLEVYADPVIDELDYEGYWVHHRLFRDSCANLNGNFIKDLSYLGRPLHTVIIIDNSPTSYLFQPRNAVPVSSWFDDPTDTELRDLIPVLEQAAKADNVYPVLDEHRRSIANFGSLYDYS
eukprot:TRINITY_DN9936_c0_g1_i2.p1 TRINITY_DN9936_c0_g1~~TRINITY_DN9936_c0_g1_i2.p1  ORF type:complete len:400 (+),score=16.80 TRINITY_DN9936_c0_g1_i2:70-1269(+)